MTKVLTVAVALALATHALSASAWWDNWVDDFFGDGFATGEFDFGFGIRGRSHGYGSDAPYWGYAPYYRLPPYYAPPPLTEEQRAAMAGQRKLLAEQRKKAFEQAVTAQREFAERLNREMRPPVGDLPADISKRLQEHAAQRDAMRKQRESRYHHLPAMPQRPEGMQRQRQEVHSGRDEMRHKQREQRNPLSSQSFLPGATMQPEKEM